jgi:hypothetical protein
MPPKHTINYKRVGEAIEHYGKIGYEYIEAPWLVSKEAIDITRPPTVKPFETFMGQLVASGEQSFLEMRNDLCPSRKYQCATPCFRDDKPDKFHLTYFFKVELIIVLWKTDEPDKYLNMIIMDAYNFHRRYFGYGTYPVVVDTDIGKDINICGVEVGSYGFREHNGFRWIYGTGLAEPRLSQVLEIAEEERERENAEIEELCK